MTYISSPALAASGRQAVMQAQTQLSKDQKELSCGMLDDVGLGLGSTSGQYLSLTDQQNQLQSITTDNALASTRLSATDNALTSLQTAASSFLASLTTANSTGAQSMATLQSTATDNLQATISTVNTSVGGQYIFGGINSGAQPMAPYPSSPPSAAKTAVDAAFSSAFGTTQTSTGANAITGPQMTAFLNGTFSSLFGGTGFSSWSSASDQPITSRIGTNQTITTSISANTPAIQKLTQAYTMVSEFGQQNFNTDAGKAVIAAATQLVSDAVSNLSDLQGTIGVAQNAVTASTTDMTAQINVLSGQSGAMAGLSSNASYDITTQLTALQTQIQASYEVTSKLQQMSLVNYIH